MLKLSFRILTERRSNDGVDEWRGMTRIVLDSNFPARGHFNSGRLQHLIDMLGSDVEIVIPEVVIWEWAEHATTAIEALVDEHQRLRVDRLLYAPPAMPEAPEKDALVVSIRRSLPRGVRVWRPQSDESLAAVRAQVLQTGTGERKKGVKTGAADHLVMACVEAQLADRQSAEAVLLASGDKRLRATCEAAFSDEVLFAESDYDLLRRLTEFEPAEDELFEAAEEALRDRIPDFQSDIGSALETFAMGFDIVNRRQNIGRNERELARLGRVEIVELHDLEVGQLEGEARAGYADVRIFGSVHMTVLEMQHHRTGSEWIQTFSGLVTGAMIDLKVHVAFDRDWQLISVAPASAAEIDFDQMVDDDEDEDWDLE